MYTLNKRQCLRNWSVWSFGLTFGLTTLFTNELSAKPVFAQVYSVETIGESSSQPKTDFEHESADFIAKILYARPSSTYKSMAASGAVGTNADWEEGLAKSWYIEAQRRGEEAVISGLIKNDKTAIEAGLKMFDWGFAQQSADGGFKGTGDSFHSTSLFVQAVARTLLMIEQSPQSQKYTEVVKGYLPALHLAARWMIQPEVWLRGISNNQPYTHRRYVVATALGLTSQLTGDSELMDYARQSLTDGLALQQSNGVNPELGGYDSSYQMVSVIYAAQWVTYFPENPLTADVIEMINKAINWEQSRVLANGEISSEGNTRTSGQEILRTGQAKKINHREIMRGFAYWASVSREQKWEEVARQVAQFYYSDDKTVMKELYRGFDFATLIYSPTAVEPQPESIPEPSTILGTIAAGVMGLALKRKS